MTRVLICDGFHGRSTMEIEDSRLQPGEFPGWVEAWLSPAEVLQNRPCTGGNCRCGDTFKIIDVRDHGYGDVLVSLRTL